MSKDFLFPTNLGGDGTSLANQAIYNLIEPTQATDPTMTLSYYYATYESNDLYFILTVTIGPIDLADLAKEQINFGIAFGISDHGSFDGV